MIKFFKLLNVLTKRDIYKYFNNDVVQVYQFLNQNCRDYDTVLDYNVIYIFLGNRILQRLIPFIQPDYLIFELTRDVFDCNVNRKVFRHYIFPFINEDIEMNFYYTYNNSDYLTDQEKFDYIMVLLNYNKEKIYLEIVLKDIKDEKLKKSAEMMINLL